MLLFFVVIYFLITILIGWYASLKVKTTQDFVVAGKNLPMFVAACGLFATWFGSETIMGASGAFLEGGFYGVIEDPFGAALCLFLIGLWIAKPLHDRNILTFADFYKMRFNRASEVIASICMIPSYFGWIAAQLVAMAFILNIVSGIPIFWGIFCCALVVTIYTYIGGMWSVSITDFVQTIMIIIGLAIITVDIVYQAGGLGRIFEVAGKENPHFFKFLPDWNVKSVISYLAAWMTIGLGSVPQQDVFQRVMAAKTTKSAITASYLSSIMYLTIAFMPLLIALGGKILYPDVLKGDMQMVILNVIMQHTGIWIQVLFFGALMSAILSTTSGAILAPSTVMGENVIRPLMKDISDAQLLRIMRISVIVIAVISAGLANLKSNIYELVGDSSALSLVSLFTPLIAGLYWKKASSFGANASMLIGLMVWSLCEWKETEFPSLIYGFGASILAMLIGSYLYPNKEYRA